MKIRLDIDSKLKDIFVDIRAPKLDKKVYEIMNLLEKERLEKLTAYRNSKIYLINIEDIYCFYTEARKVCLYTENESFYIKYTLLELEERLKGTSMIRASKGVIINMDKVLNFEQMFNGNLVVNFENGKKEYVSRRYLKNIKDYLNIGGN
ncbi:TPA: LytTR family transcriptional regulator DNA-binding domain-containing protein [Clostridium perfringens]|uniref:LytTR family DNA-binding domain-containing protein n=2 Tax=Clostridium perfringens TaxID=1502 RepID=UPI000D71786F|nr:LytTR family DNA-binding domain-containing protein [Clostridium perfringens]EHK2364235.1 LytTR family transcriptional regulator DNA-binding domain-containing protein [Clostridium perfringens]EJT5928246.1 LytTR family transcriptional regulator DNA-binding domain-containing protein [Clostridium perfringens]EJT6482915.1 LytTR family transcriptional regulator DNA-binding domain-containing protein [Clostridium perfringens]MDK0788417.1 LytTR family DNA-binding domain-containing protein [Clostridiu